MEGNQQKMREVLFLFVHDFASFRKDVENGNLHMMQCMDFVKEFIPLMESALSAPLRQCDVGTVEEQSNRFRDFCKIESSASGGHCTGCRAICYGKNKCELAWAQMPYESSNSKGE